MIGLGSSSNRCCRAHAYSWLQDASPANSENRLLVLQLSLRTGFALMPLPVTVLGHGLMDAPPQRPAKEMIEHYAGGTLQAANELADLAHAEGDQSSRLRSPLLCDVTALSFTRRAARKP